MFSRKRTQVSPNNFTDQKAKPSFIRHSSLAFPNSLSFWQIFGIPPPPSLNGGLDPIKTISHPGTFSLIIMLGGCPFLGIKEGGGG